MSRRRTIFDTPSQDYSELHHDPHALTFPVGLDPGNSERNHSATDRCLTPKEGLIFKKTLLRSETEPVWQVDLTQRSRVTTAQVLRS